MSQHRIRRVFVAGLSAITIMMPAFASAQTVADLQTQIAALLAQLKALQQQLAVAQGNSWCHTFSMNLKIGQSGAEVVALQTALQTAGVQVTANENFDDQTASAVTGFQEKYASEILTPNGLQYGTGYVGIATRAKLNALYGCGLQTIPIPPIIPPSSTPTPTPISSRNDSLTITLDPAIAAQSQSVTPGGTGYILLVADLTAGASAGVTISSLNFGCGGYACNTVKNLRMVGVRPNTQTWIGSPSNGLVFAPNLTILAGTTQVVELIGDVSSNAPAGQQIQYALNDLLVNLAHSGTARGSAYGNVLTVAGSSSTQSVDIKINGSDGPLTVQSGASLNVTWNSTGIPYTCSVSFNPTGNTQGIGNGQLSGSVTVNAPTVTTPTAFLYQAACPTSGTGGPAISDTVQVNITPASALALSVDLKINGSDAPGVVPFGSIITASWTSSGASYCRAYGRSVPLVDGSTWGDWVQFPPSGSKTLYAYGDPIKTYFSPIDVSLQCFAADDRTSAGDSVALPVSAPTPPPQPSVSVSLSPATFNFSIAQGQSSGYPEGQTAFIMNPNQSMTWTWGPYSPPGPNNWVGAGSGCPVVSNTATLQGFTGSNGCTVTIFLSTAVANLAPGTYIGTITFSPVSGTSPTFTPQIITVNLTVNSLPPTPSLNATTAGTGSTTGRAKTFLDDLGTVNFSVTPAGSGGVQLGNVRIAFAGTALATSTGFYNTSTNPNSCSSCKVQLYDPMNGISYFATLSDPWTRTMSFYFGSPIIFAGTTKSFILRVNSMAATAPPQAGVAQTLSASVDLFNYLNAITGGTNVIVPPNANINSVSYAVGS